VSFRYPEAADRSLENASLSLERGKFYGFVGQSGAGKSTLANLLLGLIGPTRGAISIDGRPLAEFAIADWRRRFGYVPQDAFILDATLRDNITFGEPADDARVQDAIARAGLADVVARLDGGLDTVLGERGRRFSGGQAQRVAIARALFRKPEILFFDEATSALDSVTEAEIHLAIESLRGEAMAIMIAHRISSLRRCDLIFMLDGGRIVESGTYDELLARSEPFRRLAAQGDDVTPLPATA
jgi:ATP-binding cassette subfamily C protein